MYPWRCLALQDSVLSYIPPYGLIAIQSTTVYTHPTFLQFLGRQIALMKLTPKLDGKTVTYLEMLEEKYIGRINLQEKANSNVIAGFGVGNVSLSQNITKRVGKKEVAPEHILLCLTGQGELAIYCLARISDLTDLPKAAATVRRKELSPNVIGVVCRRIPTESDTDTSRAEAGKSEATEMNAPKKSSKDDGARTVRSSLLPYSGSVSIKEELLCSSRSAAMKQELSHDGREGRPISFLFDEEDRLLHDLFSCQADMSYSVGLWEHLDGFKGLVIEEHTPGSFNHDSVYTKDEFKEILRELYVLFKCLHQRGYSLGGNFGLGNFLVYEARMRINVKFVNVPKTSLLKDKPEGEHQDLERLVRMVRWEMFNGKCVPHDVNLWLSLIFEKDIEELLPYHSSLMGIEESGDNFILWYDIFLDLEATNGSAYETICKNLRSYDNWQQILLTKEGNDHLSSTLKLQPYRHEFSDLIRLLRNSRCHDGRYHHQKFALIVRQHYPNLISDLQKELFLVGCFKGKFRVPK